MVEPITSQVGVKIVECLLSKSFSKVIDAFGNEVRRIRKLLEGNTLADLQAAIDLTRNALTLHNLENRRHHLNDAVTEYTKAIERLRNHTNSTLDITIARFGKALSYYLLDEPTNCAWELQQLQEGVQHFHEEIKSSLPRLQMQEIFQSLATLPVAGPKIVYYYILRNSNKAYLPVVTTMLSDLAFKPVSPKDMIAMILQCRKKAWVVPWEEIQALRKAAAEIKACL